MNQENKHDEWTVYDEFMRRHAPIEPPEVKLCYFCKKKALQRCEICNKASCQRHSHKCVSCGRVICLIEFREEYDNKEYCNDCC